MKISASGSASVLAALLWSLFHCAATGAATINVACGTGGSGVGAAFNSANPGDTISVTGSCSENILVRNEKTRIVLNGNNSASINGPSSATPTIRVRGKGIAILNFTSLSGGSNVISVERGGNAVIRDNTIQNAGSRGVVVTQFGFAVITNNTIQNNPSDGILINSGSSAHIGFDQTSDVAASPNTIQGNGSRGIQVTRGSIARIYGNTIQNNANDGVGVFRNSTVDLSSNTIENNGTSFGTGCNGNSNGCNGVSAAHNSHVNLGEDNPVDFTDQPNITDPAKKNGNFGIRCVAGANIRGHLGSSNQLNGNQGQFGGGSSADTFGGNCPTPAANLVP